MGPGNKSANRGVVTGVSQVYRCRDRGVRRQIKDRILYFSDRRHGRERLCEQILNDANVDWDSRLGQICVVPGSIHKVSVSSDAPQQQPQ